jgi:chitin synthase
MQARTPSRPTTPQAPHLQPLLGPTDDDIFTQIKMYLSTADLMSVTKKQVRDEMTRVFNIDMTPRKEYINQCIERILQG